MAGHRELDRDGATPGASEDHVHGTGRLAGVKPRTVRRWVYQGKLAAGRQTAAGRVNLYFKTKEVLRLLGVS